MQLTNLLGLCLAALATSAAAMPRIAGPYRGDRIAVHVPTNSTGAHNATTTGTHAKKPLTTGSAHSNGTSGRHFGHVHHVPNHIKHINHCQELCSLESQTCTIAVPDDDKFCWKTYLRCIDRCRPEDFQ
ncbi:hypothetical protein N7462_005576 [Penicillium macrosclerotiorum]|uniref:uncharacterized protein n=1 Tax=Penicillium macrosclerotiorum TaxID=303699 RepID=UPI0025479C79|nr:uncharacterized protein N7462_005576 [Penicillium macrosclerotiorum]KAJ5682411.1 hypothetical protein N7462_005576 [Penicillium macrosclerotiorum]